MEQARTFLGALGLGVALGLVYDLFRVLRLRLPLRILGGMLDLLYWPLTVCALFVYTVAVGDGVVRIYLMLGVALGNLLYFGLLSSVARYLGDKLADFFVVFGYFFIYPVQWVEKLWKNFW